MSKRSADDTPMDVEDDEVDQLDRQRHDPMRPVHWQCNFCPAEHTGSYAWTVVCRRGPNGPQLWCCQLCLGSAAVNTAIAERAAADALTATWMAALPPHGAPPKAPPGGPPPALG